MHRRIYIYNSYQLNLYNIQSCHFCSMNLSLHATVRLTATWHLSTPRIHFFEVLNEKFSDLELRQLYDKAGRILARSLAGFGGEHRGKHGGHRGKHEASTGLTWFNRFQKGTRIERVRKWWSQIRKGERRFFWLNGGTFVNFFFCLEGMESHSQRWRGKGKVEGFVQGQFGELCFLVMWLYVANA